VFQDRLSVIGAVDVAETGTLPSPGPAGQRSRVQPRLATELSAVGSRQAPSAGLGPRDDTQGSARCRRRVFVENANAIRSTDDPEDTRKGGEEP
jgi:hypothetical protein